MSDNVTITGIDVLKPGTYTDANGTEVVVTAAMIAEMAAEFAPDLQDAPAVVGHPKMDDPAYGWLRNFRVGENEDGEPVLFCDAIDVDPEFAETLRKKRFKRKSLSFYLPRSRGNPKPGKCYPKHLGLLGARAPAVMGLKPIAFAADDEAVVIELAGPRPWVFRSIANVLSGLRDFLVESQGLEKAETIISTYTINDLRDTAAEMEAEPQPNFASPENHGGQMATPEEIAAREAALNEREAALVTREQSINGKEVALAAAEAADRKRNDTIFVDGLIAAGKLPTGEKDNVLAELAAADDGATAIDLAAGEDGQPAKLTQRQAMLRRLSLLPKLVELGEFNGGEATVDLASADEIARAASDYRDAEGKAGRSVTTAQAVLHVTSKRG